MAEKIYPEGLRAFSPKSGAPDFVKGDIIIEPNKLFAWLKKNTGLLSEYNGEKQLRLQLLEGNKGLYIQVNDYKPGEKKKESIDDSERLPF
jgi:hypothetical protein